ncbi:MAG TPA: TonB family protein [Gemmatimonadaceae bacterium]|nr:TonB family protein [Gemmatimonadaceae bacterium]
MLSTLIESKRTRSRNRGATAVSVIVHGAVIALVAAVTAHVSDRTATAAPVPDVVYFHPAEPTSPHKQPPPAGPQAPSEPQIPNVPVTHIDVPHDIPTGIPPIDLSVPPIDPSHFAIAPTTSSGRDASGAAPHSGSDAYSAWEVEKPVVPLAGNPKPEYPSMLQSSHTEGQVLAQFVVDTTGRVDMATFRAIQATNELFVQSVRRALTDWKFRPAEAGGRKVKQLVQMPLTFRVR